MRWLYQVGKVEISVFDPPQPQQEDEWNDHGAYHKDMITDIVNVSSLNKYVTCSRDGTLRVWASKTLNHVQTIKISDKTRAGACPWVTNATEARGLQSGTYPFGVLAVVAADKQMRMYDMKNFALLSTVALGEDVSPLCCTGFVRKDVVRRAKNATTDHMIAIGDSEGKIVLYEQVWGRGSSAPCVCVCMCVSCGVIAICKTTHLVPLIGGARELCCRFLHISPVTR
jgi:WD40 repeat protein